MNLLGKKLLKDIKLHADKKELAETEGVLVDAEFLCLSTMTLAFVLIAT
jgi:hypothetical protein